MRRAIGVVMLSIFMLSFTGGFAAAAEEAADKAAQEVCPVMGGKVNRDVFVDYDGQRVYFCCEYCKKEFWKDPQGYMEKMEEAEESGGTAPKGGSS